MTDNTQPQTWRKVLSKDLGFGHDPDEYTVCAPDLPELDDFIHHLSELQADTIIADHAAATKLAERDAEIEDLRALLNMAEGRVPQLVQARFERDNAYAEADALARALDDAMQLLGRANHLLFGGGPAPHGQWPTDYAALVAVAAAARERVKARDGIIPLDERRHV